MTLGLSVIGPTGEVVPGTTGTAIVRVENQATTVRAVRLDVLGIERWATVDPPELRLFPGDIGEATVNLRPPRTAGVASGSHPFAIRARSVGDGASVVEESEVVVAPFNEVSGDLRPKVARGRTGAKFDLRVTNLGNTRRRVLLSADDPDNMLRLDVSPAYLLLEPGDSGSAAGKAQTAQTAGPGERLPFTVRIEGDGTEPALVDGALAIKKPMGKWLARAAALLMALVVLAIAFMALRPDGVQTSARDAKPREDDTTTSLFSGVGDTTLAPGETAPPDTAPPDSGGGGGGGGGSNETAPPDTAPPDTAPGETAPPDTAAPDTTAPPTATTIGSGVSISPNLTFPILTIPIATTTTTTIAPRTTPAWAVVDGSGKIKRQGGVSSVARTAAGRYTVTFAHSVTGCALNASPSGTNGQRTITVTGAIVVVRNLPLLSSSAAVVQVRDLAGTAVDTEFTIMRTCDKHTAAFVVVNKDGTKARSSTLAPSALARTAAGTYSVSFNTSKVSSTCTPVVTAGNSGSTIDNGRLIGVKAAVTLPGTTLTTWSVVVRNPLTGLPIDDGFHFTLRCGTAVPHGFFKGRAVQSGAANVTNYTVVGLFTNVTGLMQARTSSIAVASSCGAVASPRDVTSALVVQSGASAVVSYVSDDPLNKIDAAHFDVRSNTVGGAVNRDMDLHVSCS